MAKEVKKEQAAKQNAKQAKDSKGSKKSSGEQVVPKGWVPNLQKEYKERIMGELQKQFNFKSAMQIPRLEKITINQGVGIASQDKKLVENAAEELTMITGQKAVLTYSRKDIASFKLRRGMPIGCKVTLRRAKMYEFMERLVKVSLPRIRDFKGVEEKFDGKGNYTLGLKEQIIFPEIDIDKVSKVLGMEITFVTSTTKDEEARALLAAFGVPFKKK
ncbi:MAG: 50S ribosomal protein L5 [Bacteroidales bacterium]|nr:50S ribosomal protein L5 [Bacteroidales bacterium]